MQLRGRTWTRAVQLAAGREAKLKIACISACIDTNLRYRRVRLLHPSQVSAVGGG